MLVACKLSEYYGLNEDVLPQLKKLLKRYELPVSQKADKKQVMDVLSMDKKRNNNSIDFIILNAVGKASIRPLALETIEMAIESFTHASARKAR